MYSTDPAALRVERVGLTANANPRHRQTHALEQPSKFVAVMASPQSGYPQPELSFECDAGTVREGYWTASTGSAPPERVPLERLPRANTNEATRRFEATFPRARYPCCTSSTIVNPSGNTYKRSQVIVTVTERTTNTPILPTHPFKPPCKQCNALPSARPETTLQCDLWS